MRTGPVRGKIRLKEMMMGQRLWENQKRKDLGRFNARNKGRRFCTIAKRLFESNNRALDK